MEEGEGVRVFTLSGMFLTVHDVSLRLLCRLSRSPWRSLSERVWLEWRVGDVIIPFTWTHCHGYIHIIQPAIPKLDDALPLETSIPCIHVLYTVHMCTHKTLFVWSIQFS